MQSQDRLSENENAQLLHIVRDCSDNLRHAKTQQWHAGHLAILGYAAIIGAKYLLTSEHPQLAYPQLCSILSVWGIFAFGACAGGIALVWNLQIWMRRLRQTLSAAEDKFSCTYKNIAQATHGEQYDRVLYGSFQTVLISIVIVVGWAVAERFITSAACSW